MEFLTETETRQKGEWDQDRGHSALSWTFSGCYDVKAFFKKSTGIKDKLQGILMLCYEQPCSCRFFCLFCLDNRTAAVYRWKEIHNTALCAVSVCPGSLLWEEHAFVKSNNNRNKITKGSLAFHLAHDTNRVASDNKPSHLCFSHFWMWDRCKRASISVQRDQVRAIAPHLHRTCLGHASSDRAHMLPF